VRVFFRKGKALVAQKRYNDALFFFSEALRWIRKAKDATSEAQVLVRLRWSEAAFLYILGRTHQQADQYLPAFGSRCGLVVAGSARGRPGGAPMTRPRRSRSVGVDECDAFAPTIRPRRSP